MAGLGALIALALLGFIGLQLGEGGAEPPTLVTRVERVVAGPGGHVAEIEVRNLSGATAAAVEIEGTLAEGDTIVETSRATIDYVPGRGRRRAGLLFTQDPAGHHLAVRATGYQEP
jgi:uncharacterized protein (TIGR02588 family)